MSPFITFRDIDKQGKLQYYILQRDFPHYVGLLSTRPMDTVISNSAIAGYYLWIVFWGTLRGPFIPAYNGVDKDIQSLLDNMADWFCNERIMEDEKKFKKFKIGKDVQKPT